MNEMTMAELNGWLQENRLKVSYDNLGGIINAKFTISPYKKAVMQS